LHGSTAWLRRRRVLARAQSAVVLTAVTALAAANNPELLNSLRQAGARPAALQGAHATALLCGGRTTWHRPRVAVLLLAEPPGGWDRVAWSNVP